MCVCVCIHTYTRAYYGYYIKMTSRETILVSFGRVYRTRQKFRLNRSSVFFKSFELIFAKTLLLLLLTFMDTNDGYETEIVIMNYSIYFAQHETRRVYKTYRK